MDLDTPMVSVHASEKAQKERAYVTFLAGNGDYVKGVVGLAKGLRKVKSAYPLVVAVLADVPEEHREILRSQGCVVREIEPVHPPEGQDVYARDYYIITYSKFRVWSFEEYSKMVFLDADIQLFGNIDDLFDLEDGYVHGVLSCFCETSWSFSPLYSIGYCQYCPEKVTWPNEIQSSPPPPYFNGGMFVFEPSPLTCESLLQTLKVTPPSPFSEQDFLNMFFEKLFKPVPPVYNLILSVLWRHPGIIDPERVKVVHYCPLGSKPWKYTGEEPNMDREDVKMLIKKWWDIYNDESLDFKPKSNGVDLKDTISKPTIITSVTEPSVTCLNPAAPAVI
uniref:Hexosyltransferase n=1 Tax=Noccaea caerulescens TaxID=107243 RepID=A0A1J3DIW3_NOCCA